MNFMAQFMLLLMKDSLEQNWTRLRSFNTTHKSIICEFSHGITSKYIAIKCNNHCTLTYDIHEAQCFCEYKTQSCHKQHKRYASLGDNSHDH